MFKILTLLQDESFLTPFKDTCAQEQSQFLLSLLEEELGGGAASLKVELCPVRCQVLGVDEWEVRNLSPRGILAAGI